MLSWFVAFTLVFILIVQKLFVFVNAHDVPVDEHAMFCYILWKQAVNAIKPLVALNITTFNTLDIDNIDY